MMRTLSTTVLNLPSEMQAGAHSRIGNDHRTNDDSQCLFQTGPYTVMVIADGVSRARSGGSGYGAEASSAAVKGASEFLNQALRNAPLSKELFDAAFEKAQAQIDQSVARRPEISGKSQTTLIVIAIDTETGRGFLQYIGDGGVCIQSEQGKIEQLLLPMHPKDPDMDRYLTGALGSPRLGRPKGADITLVPGDLLLAGSDGALDYLPSQDTFYKLNSQLLLPAIRQTILEFEGNVARAMKYVVETLGATAGTTHLLSDDITISAFFYAPKQRADAQSAFAVSAEIRLLGSFYRFQKYPRGLEEFLASQHSPAAVPSLSEVDMPSGSTAGSPDQGESVFVFKPPRRSSEIYPKTSAHTPGISASNSSHSTASNRVPFLKKILPRIFGR